MKQLYITYKLSDFDKGSRGPKKNAKHVELTYAENGQDYLNKLKANPGTTFYVKVNAGNSIVEVGNLSELAKLITFENAEGYLLAYNQENIASVDHETNSKRTLFTFEVGNDKNVSGKAIVEIVKIATQYMPKMANAEICLAKDYAYITEATIDHINRLIVLA